MTAGGFYSRVLRAGLIFLSVSFFTDIHAQFTTINDSIINDYQKIISIHSLSESDPDSVIVENASSFNSKEIVLFIVNQGALIRTEEPGIGDIAEIKNTGKYALIFVDTVEYDKNLVIFNSTLPGITLLNPGEKAQLVTVPRYKNMLLANKLTCKAWDPETGTGGVLVFMVNNMLELNADIDVTGKGFKGAVPGNEVIVCSSADSGYYNNFFITTSENIGGLRGEGIAESSFPYARGRLAAGNSGSGGSGRFSGGGGGSNAGAGGKGGKEWNMCFPNADIGGLGGKDLFPKGFYHNSNQYANRIYMGGGGGAGTQDIQEGKIATRGGNGGGLVIFTANKVNASGYSIIANGESVTGLASAGAGGGGGGGVIVADVLVYSDPIVFEMRGGKGGNVLANADTTGPGGGGGGGVFWFSQPTVNPGVISNFLFGGQGKVDGNDNNYGATNGSPGNRIPNLVLPRRGFLINQVPDDQIICEGSIPQLLIPPPASGGDGPPYNYKWLQSQISFKGPWIPAEGTNNQANYAPPALTDTTYYCRVISDGTLLVDTSFAIIVTVIPGILNNEVILNDTICAQLSAGELTLPLEITGGSGSGSYSFSWEMSYDNSIWLPATGINNLPAYQTPVLSESINFRRKVISGVCVDTSNNFKINILPDLTNNIIEGGQVICYEQQPAALTGSNPSGGLTDDLRYTWEKSDDLESWTSVSMNQAYIPEILTDTAYYRRIVVSGPNNTCENISNTVSINVLPILENNITNHQDTILCAGLAGLSLSGLQPVGGDGRYKYFWEKRLENTNSWEITQQLDSLQAYNTGSLTNSTWFRRIIKSGPEDVCSSISDSFLVSILPGLSNNTISFPQVICENISPDPLSGTVPEGGDGSYLYEWQSSSDGTENWQSASPVNTDAGYTPPVTGVSTFYRRIVYSGPNNTCQNFSGEIKIEVQSSIANNNILNGIQLFTCFGTQPELITGSSNITGGDGTSYQFVWEESRDSFNWIPASQDNFQKDYQPQILVDSIFYRRKIISGACSDITSTLIVNINPLPILNSLVTSSQFNSVCDDEKLFLKVNIQNGKAPFHAWYSNTIDAEIFSQVIPTDTGSFLVNITGAEPNEYIFRINELTDQNGCKATSENLNLHFADIDVYRAAHPEIASDGLMEVCGNLIMLTAIPDFGGGVWRSSNPLISFSDSLNTASQATITTPGFNTLFTKIYYAESAPGCGENKDSVSVIFYEEPDDPIIATDTTGFSPYILFMSDNIQLTSVPSGAGTGSWLIDSGPGEITSQDNNTALVSNLKINEQTKVIFTVENGVCNAKTDFIIVERKNVKIYEGFSPNDDKVNDFLYTEGIDRSSDEMNYSLSIFNNSGAFVIELNNDTPLLSNENDVIWDGISRNGKVSADGTYYYIMKVDYKGSEFSYKGFFVLKSK